MTQAYKLGNGLYRLLARPQVQHREGLVDRCQLREFLTSPDYLSRVPLNKEMYQIIDAIELSARWNLPVTWIREYCRPRTSDPIPHLRLGHYVRFQWDSPELTEWLERHAVGTTSKHGLVQG